MKELIRRAKYNMKRKRAFKTVKRIINNAPSTMTPEEKRQLGDTLIGVSMRLEHVVFTTQQLREIRNMTIS